MRKLRKLLFLLPLGVAVTSLAGCKNETNVRVLRILNCEDYIFEYEEGDEEELDLVKKGKDVMDMFVDEWKKNTGETIEYVYDTFDTNETMFNELQTGKTTYDVIVPSDYMIQKLISNKMLHKISDENKPDLWKNISPYLKDKFENSLGIADYAVPYMWGTVGLMYNPSYYMERNQELKADDVHKLFENWDSLYTSEDIRGTFSIKDSVRDTYAVSLVHAFSDEIAKTNDPVKLEKIFNRNDAKNMAIVKQDMLTLKDAAFGFECDSGKTDMTTQKIGANMCWSGDATWAITEAEEFDLTLYYSIPTSYNGEDAKGASNVWFDGFCMPKSEDLHKDLAQEFIKFMSQPENAAQNCYCVGYTPGVAGDAMLDYVYDCYDVRGEVGGTSDEEYVEYDLRYFFKDSLDEYSENDAILHASIDYVGRQLTAQYPSAEILDRLAIMNDFGPEGNARLLDMWEQVRTNALPLWGIIILAVEAVAGIAFAAYLITHKVNRKRFKKERRS